MKMTFRLLQKEQEHEVMFSSDCKLHLLIRQAVLHELKAAGILNEMQCRDLERTLQRQFGAGVSEK